MSDNVTTIVGRLGKDPEEKGSGVRFSVAVSRPGKKDGKELTDWFNVWAYGKQGEIAMQYLTKGKLVVVSGRMQSYQKDPDSPQQWSLYCNSFQMLGDGKGEPSAPKPKSPHSPTADSDESYSMDEDELPPF